MKRFDDVQMIVKERVGRSVNYISSNGLQHRYTNGPHKKATREYLVLKTSCAWERTVQKRREAKDVSVRQYYKHVHRVNAIIKI